MVLSNGTLLSNNFGSLKERKMIDNITHYRGVPEKLTNCIMREMLMWSATADDGSHCLLCKHDDAILQLHSSDDKVVICLRDLMMRVLM